jgi:hypothetical protein
MGGQGMEARLRRSKAWEAKARRSRAWEAGQMGQIETFGLPGQSQSRGQHRGQKPRRKNRRSLHAAGALDVAACNT